MTTDELRNKISLGQQQLQKFVNADDGDPACWKDNIFDLMNVQCLHLTYQSRSSIAIKLAMCHLEQSGITIPAIHDNECNANSNGCLQAISSDAVAFSTYNHFFGNIDNICIYVQMSERDKNMKNSINDLYTATIDSADFMMQSVEKQMEFQQNIKEKQDEIQQTNEDILAFHHQHDQNIQNLQSTATDIKQSQGDIFEKQIEFQTKQDEFAATITQIDDKQHDILANQDKMDTNMNNLNEKYSAINGNVQSSIKLQEESMEQQQAMHSMQHSFHDEMKENNQNVQTFFDESAKKQMTILSKQDDAFDTITNIQTKTDELHKETENIQIEMNAMYQAQKEDIHVAQEEIAALTKDSQNAYAQIMAMMDEALFVLNAIYKMDMNMLRQFISIQSCAFYIFWMLWSYFSTVPNAARSVRIWLFVGMAICVVLEKNVHWLIPVDFDAFFDDDLHEMCMVIRKFMFSMNMTMYVWFALTYKDPAKEQMKLLKNIDKTIRQRAPPRVVTKRISFMSALSSITPRNLRRAMNF